MPSELKPIPATRLSLLREAAAWGWLYRDAIPGDQWKALAEAKVVQLAARGAAGDPYMEDKLREALRWGSWEGRLVPGSQWGQQRDAFIAKLLHEPLDRTVPDDALSIALRQLSAVDPDGAFLGAAETTWEHLRTDAARSGLAVDLSVIEKNYAPTGKLGTERFPVGAFKFDRFHVQFHRPDGRAIPAFVDFGANGKAEFHLDGRRVPGLFATSDVETQRAWLNTVLMNGRELRIKAGLADVPLTVPLDWDGRVEVRGCVPEGDGVVIWASEAGKPAAFYGVYAGRTSGGVRHVADFADGADAARLAAGLRGIAKRYGNAIPTDYWIAPASVDLPYIATPPALLTVLSHVMHDAPAALADNGVPDEDENERGMTP